MDAVDLIRRLHEHRAWVNRNLRQAARDLPGAALQRPLAIGQGSLWKTLLHLYGAEYAWLEALTGNEKGVAPGDVADKLPGNQQGKNPIGSLAELESHWSDLDARWKSYLDNLSSADLEQPVAKVSADGKRRITARSDVLLHVCTHAQYTVAQAVNMLRQLGVERFPDVMLIAMARQQMGNP
jgi:uncharacterized damage-inducible protein DinB